ncbi:pyridoxamine 5'-phosphate oxidase family protein [Halobacillus sp. A1]|uniref:pyridoxamine 5'-phosphate oxidase family protein n=1 Tax=Halobacillus sp. A1 TaxID=2880262 RepID=UPI0020A6A8F4|nr:pyridoxamine 5'-phosphate oxidase family protein [Halobacillus sp. A1]MCP3031855.1 pyridoxamine 5'-phosphate oxidase family protein [Halobacillus sp. A1]
MNQEELKKKIYNIMDQHKIGTLATVKKGKPHSRYMTFSNDDEFTFYTPTNKDTHKADEIEENPNVHILIGYEGEGLGDSYLEVEGQAKIRDDQKMKDWLWSEPMERWFTGKGDPDYIVLEIYPESIRLMNAEGDTPATLDL